MKKDQWEALAMCVFFFKYLPKCYKITAGVGCVKSDYSIYVEMISIFLF
jgi:hypothetical protein